MPKKPKMSKLAKDTLKEMAKEPVGNKCGCKCHYGEYGQRYCSDCCNSKPHVCESHSHDRFKCDACGIVFSMGQRNTSERIVYRTPWQWWLFMWLLLGVFGTFGGYWTTHPKIVHDTVKIYDPVQDALVKQLDFENGELRDQHSQDVARMAAVHDLLDLGKFHGAYKMSKPKESK